MKKHPIYNSYLIFEDGRIFKDGKSEPIKPRTGRDGYVTVSICTGNGESLTRRVHRLVCETYLPNPDNKPEVNHKDGNKLNNSLCNLEWCTSKENKAHAWDNGYYHKNLGSNQHTAVLTEEIVHKVCKMLQEGYRNKDISDLLEIGKDHIASIRRGRIWKQISKFYTFEVKRNKRKSLETVRKIKEEILSGKSNKEISDNFKMSCREVNRIRTGEIFKEVM